MIDALLNVHDGESWDDLRGRVGGTLGLDGPVPSPVLRRMMAEPAFAHNVLTCRNTPGFLLALFDDPRTRAYHDAADDAPAAPAARRTASERSSAELLRSAAGALMRWGKAGFSTVDAATFQRRWEACQACAHLMEPPGEKLLYRVRLASDVDGRVCDACGCVAARKARLPGENCPVASDADPLLNRWGEPRPVTTAEENVPALAVQT